MYMTYTLTLSSQGQVVIPSQARKKLGLKPGSKLVLNLDAKSDTPKATLEPLPDSWTEYASGIGKGVWGNGEQYVNQQRKDW
jgi:AbrB family looped-hinge helix DNA binding protein